MARGQQKIQSQQKAAKRQQDIKKQQGHDQKAAALKALTHVCTVCKVSVYLLNHIEYPVMQISFEA